jgi:hypothetical protein
MAVQLLAPPVQRPHPSTLSLLMVLTKSPPLPRPFSFSWTGTGYPDSLIPGPLPWSLYYVCPSVLILDLPVLTFQFIRWVAFWLTLLPPGNRFCPSSPPNSNQSPQTCRRTYDGMGWSSGKSLPSYKPYLEGKTRVPCHWHSVPGGQ